MNKEAKCIDCGKIIYIGLRGSNKTCRCEECKNKHNQYVYPNKFKNGIKTSKLNCNIFDIECDNCYFKQHDICKSKSSIKYKLKTLSKYCKLVISDYETTLKEYLNIKQKFQNLIDSGLSGVDICSIYFNDPKKGNTVFKILDIKCRNIKESVKNAVLQGKIGKEIYFNQYKSAWHTTWNNKEVFLRSSYELDYANKLDKKQIDYEVEFKHIKYWDSQRQEYRCAIPDFYIPSQNLIVEIKSSWTLDKQNMKDKMKAYQDLGYNTELICDHQKIEL